MKEPPGLMHTDGKSSDGVTLIPWMSGKSVALDVTEARSLANLYFELAA